MSAFGWSLPAGCGSLPYDGSEATELKFDGLPEQDFGVFWTEDGDILLITYPGGDNERIVSKIYLEWNDDLDDLQNIAEASKLAAAEFERISI